MGDVTDETKKIGVYVACAAVAAFLWFVLSGNLPSDRARDKAIREQFATLERNQRDLATRLDGIAKDLAQSQRRIETISGRIANAEAGVSEVAGQLADSQIALTESAGLIDANKRIIQAIQSRAEKNSVPVKD